MLRRALLLTLGTILTTALSPARADELEQGLADPPEATKPWVYWYWISDNITREGITRDLESMARVGIGEAFIGNIFLDDVPAGPAKVLTDEWWGLVEHSIREGQRVGVRIGMFNCPGWSQSGGPWITPERAMRYLVSSETRVTGPADYDGKLPVPAEPFQNVAVLAFPEPQSDDDAAAVAKSQVTAAPVTPGAEHLTDDRLDTDCTLPAAASADGFALEWTFPEPFTARSLLVYPAAAPVAGDVTLEVADGAGGFQAVRTFRFDRSNMAVGVGPMPRGPVTIALPATVGTRFRVTLKGFSQPAALAEVRLSGAARLERFVEKQLGKMNPTPLPMWDTYLWPTQPEPESAELVVPAEGVVDLSSRLRADGSLVWRVPDGRWVIVRMGMTPTGTRNAPASPEGQGLEVDKMNREAVGFHFNAFMGQILARMPSAGRTALARVVADSYEMGSQNWTDGFADTFRERYGYDPRPWLPVLTGRLIGSADRSERFLWDLRRLVADRVATDYVGGLRDACHPHGLGLWLENYGHWGFPSEFLMYGGQSDRLGGEFWVTGTLGSIELRAAASASAIYGKPIVSAEAFTGGPAFQNAPSALKARGDWAFCEGINHFVLHVSIHQPWEDRVPGMNAWFGTEFNRHNTWFASSRAWVDYLRRCCFLLQRGTRVADVAYFIGEDSPKMSGPRQPELPPGYDCDDINAEAIIQRLQVADGRLVLPGGGGGYRVLVLPELPTMRPAVLRKIGALVEEGATVLGRPPLRSPSMENFPACDDEVRRLAGALWGDADTSTAGERQVGKGRIVWGKSLEALFAETGVDQDFASGEPLRCTHRRDGEIDIYFLANPKPEAVATTARFRVEGRAPEFYRPVTGQWQAPAAYEAAGQSVQVPLVLEANESVFVIFRKPADPAEGRIVAATRDGQRLFDAAAPVATETAPADAAGASGSFSFALWVKPADDTTLPVEANQGVRGMSEPRNDAIFPAHGSAFGPGPEHAGCGLAVGRNGVCVFEHGASYFAPVLVQAVRLDDWTHLAIVYRQGQPELYVNGALARTGLKSLHTVHASMGAGGGGQPFRGSMGGVQWSGAALSAADVARLAQTTPRPGLRPAAAAIELCRSGGGGLEARVWRAGKYQLRTAAGESRQIEVNSLPAAQPMCGPWEVAFALEWGAPEKIVFDELVDWTQRPEEAIRHYSGRATYRTTFDLPVIDPADQFHLDLGRVADLAVVRVNGQELATVWTSPWRVDVTAALRPGKNELEIDVVNTWNNRLVADAALPPAERRTYLAATTVNERGPSLPAGLIGPVVLHAVRTVRVP